MKKFLLFSICVAFFPALVFSQINAVTETGEEVVLNNNGTWKYKEANGLKPDFSAELKENNTPFEKASSSTFLLKSKVTNVGIWLNPKKWMFTKPDEFEDSEYVFELKNEELYALMITERIPIPMETLKEVAYENAKSVSSDLRIVEEEYRTVNGQKLIYLVMAANIQGMDFYYFGYYFSNKKGSVQLLCYTFASLAVEYEQEIEVFLNGFVETEG